MIDTDASDTSELSMLPVMLTSMLLIHQTDTLKCLFDATDTLHPSLILEPSLSFLIHNVFQWNDTNVTIPFLFLNQAALRKQDSNNLLVKIESDSNQA